MLINIVFENNNILIRIISKSDTKFDFSIWSNKKINGIFMRRLPFLNKFARPWLVKCFILSKY